ncbi:hypothetical protein BHM03_00054486 [Ensete ventricosum]|nr:hypothetical protein BHM03_00054486 [Ensete ventricosum]
MDAVLTHLVNCAAEFGDEDSVKHEARMHAIPSAEAVADGDIELEVKGVQTTNLDVAVRPQLLPAVVVVGDDEWFLAAYEKERVAKPNTISVGVGGKTRQDLHVARVPRRYPHGTRGGYGRKVGKAPYLAAKRALGETARRLAHWFTAIPSAAMLYI